MKYLMPAFSTVVTSICVFWLLDAQVKASSSNDQIIWLCLAGLSAVSGLDFRRTEKFDPRLWSGREVSPWQAFL